MYAFPLQALMRIKGSGTKSKRIKEPAGRVGQCRCCGIGKYNWDIKERKQNRTGKSRKRLRNIKIDYALDKALIDAKAKNIKAEKCVF